MRSIFRQLERLSIGLALAGMVLISVAIVVLIVDIVGRKTVGFTILGIGDVMQLLVMACICLAFPFTFLREGHVAVEFITDTLPPRLLAAVKLLVAIANCAFALALARYALGQAELQVAKGDVSSTLAIPIFWYWLPLLVGLAASAVISLFHAGRYLAAIASGRDPLRPEASSTAVH